MRRIAVPLFCLAVSTACCFGQQWEFGGMGGAGFLNNVSVSSPLGAATTGFENGGVVGGFVGQNLYPHISGELRFAYLQSDLHISSGGFDEKFSGNAEVVHYDLLWHTNRKGSRVQAFVAVGGGIKEFRGTGQEAAYLGPNDKFGAMTRTSQLKPMGDVGAGIRFSITNHVFLRTEFRDYITSFPTSLILPVNGSKFGSILMDFVPMVGISYER
jgi:hypothetical protein